MTARFIEAGFLILADLIGLALALCGTYWLKDWAMPEWGPWQPIAVSWLGWGLFFLLTGLYRHWLSHSRAYMLFSMARSLAVGSLLICGMMVGPKVLDDVVNSREAFVVDLSWLKTFILYLVLVFVFTGGLRLAALGLMRLGLRMGWGLEAMVVLSQDKSGVKVFEKLRNMPELGYRVLGFLSLEPGGKSPVEHSPFFGDLSKMREVIQAYQISTVLISHETASRDDIMRILEKVVDLPVRVLVIPDMYDVVSGHFKASFVHDLNFKQLLPHNMPAWQAHIKRAMDMSLAALLLLLTSPLLLLAALAIRFDSPGPVFYSQERIGQYGKAFRIWKFRSMRTDAEVGGPQWASKGDPRITRVGKFLRKTRIDEIPQFWCVLRGEMSIVGPRPERQHFIDQLRGEIPLYTRRLVMKPGITGWAQVRHTYDTNVEDVRKKLMYDLYYFENMSLLLDLQIMLRTILVVFTGKGAQ